ncbi:ribosome small subunit-dependent GTPase A [Roseateles terrae]|uniref:Small ribosomal subunit biogenesis GTPase RsgA n=1 Tax=Roseateles terrae TaxID=431060 RepID=A0ABR6GR39_9BURK|nr:ribosome small subunit-dependent GTPase A [Roseateles terrae]MBB3194157.1 ribosome biogenesis GTPase [Roseateles terrae]OWQ88012.1 ribosome small subunit-dependent GTPase A [Roseateles terrae]
MKPGQIGLVVRGHGRHYVVEDDNGERVHCLTRGKKSDCVVGDRVRWQRTSDHEGVIDKLEPRRNLLFRQDEWKTKSFAANLDRLLVLVAAEPQFSESQLTRALIAADTAGITTDILLNKTDLPQAEAARQRLAPYKAMGQRVLELSLKGRPDEARDTLMPLLENQATLVLGPSGTGKSTLINLLVPNAGAQVGEISQALNSGRHTTTTTQWYWLDDRRETALLDSPGFQEFGLRQIPAPELASHMADFKPYLGDCRFHNCSHRHEPGCAVLVAVEAGKISPSRYRIYDELWQELSSPPRY